MNKINQNIDLNLKIIFKSKRQRVYISDLENVDKEHMMHYEAELMADKIADVGLITRTRELCEITSFGLDIMEKYGGWKEYLEHVDQQEQQKQNYLQLKKELELQNLKLQKENFEYSKKNRALDEEIKVLSRENLRFQRQRYWIGISATILGAVLGAILL